MEIKIKQVAAATAGVAREGQIRVACYTRADWGAKIVREKGFFPLAQTYVHGTKIWEKRNLCLLM